MLSYFYSFFSEQERGTNNYKKHGVDFCLNLYIYI